jgi:hypothetical protein
VGSNKRGRRYFRIDYTARIVPSGRPYRPNAVFVTGDYQTPESAIRGLRAIMARDARVQGIGGRVDVEVHRLAQSNENEYYAELSLAMHAFQQHAYRDGCYVGGDSTPVEYERRLSALRRERKVESFKRVQSAVGSFLAPVAQLDRAPAF